MNILGIVLIVVVVDAVVVGALCAMGRAAFSPLADRFPARPPRPDALTRRRQSLRIDLFNLGGGFTISVDEDALHLTPNRLGRLMVGARGASVPWEHVRHLGTVAGLAWNRPRPVRARLGPVEVVGPAWCFELAKTTS